MKKHLLVIFFFLSAISMSYAQDTQEKTTPHMLLTDIEVQSQSTDALHSLYNFKFERADIGFRWLRYKYPQHPLPYFLLGLSEWWKIMPNPEETRYDDKFLSYMDSTIMYAKKIYDKDPDNPEAKFFLAGAYGFKGRLHSDRKHWSKATFAAKTSLEYMNQGKKQNSELGPEFLFGDAIYNYYHIWVGENYKFLRPVLKMFPKGNKELGLKQLNEVARNAFYTRVEAQYYLMRIYSTEENQPAKAYPFAQYLAQTFPDNAYFERSYARAAYQQGYMDVAEKASLSILDKIDRKMSGYEATSGRYAAFYLGYIYKLIKKDNAKAKEYFQRALKFSEETEALEAGYYIYSLLYLARIGAEEKDQNAAIKYYELIKENADDDHEAYKEAKKYLKANKKGGWLW